MMRPPSWPWRLATFYPSSSTLLFAGVDCSNKLDHIQVVLEQDERRVPPPGRGDRQHSTRRAQLFRLQVRKRWKKWFVWFVSSKPGLFYFYFCFLTVGVNICFLCPFAVYYLCYAVTSFFTLSRISLAVGKTAGQKVQSKITAAVQKVKTPVLFIPLFWNQRHKLSTIIIFVLVIKLT